MKVLSALVLTALLLPAGLRADDGVFREFSAVGSGQQVVLDWTVQPGLAPAMFHVQRSFDGQRFIAIADVRPADGVYQYTYVDDDLFKGELHTYYYRIEAVLSGDRSALSAVREVTLSFSGIRRTWGSIKAMFR